MLLGPDIPAVQMQLQTLLRAVPHTPQLRGPQIVTRQRLEELLNGVPHVQLRQAMMELLAQMQQGMGHGFRVLQGATQTSQRCTIFF